MKVDQLMKMLMTLLSWYLDLENRDTIDEKDQTIFLLNSLLKQYDELRDTFKYDKDTLTFEEVIGATYSKELDLRVNGKQTKSIAEGLNVRGRSERRENTNNRGKNKSRSKSRSKPRTNKTCWFYKKKCHFRRDCPQGKTGNH